MEFEYDPEVLIEEVRKRPGLWDSDHPEYRSKKARRTLWQEILTVFNYDKSQASKSELAELELQLQKKWKSLRDCAIKYAANPKSKRPYIYFRQLQFLVENRQNRNEETSIEQSSSNKGITPKLRRKFSIKVDHKDSEDDSNGEDGDEIIESYVFTDNGRPDDPISDEDSQPLEKRAKNTASAQSQPQFAYVDIPQKWEDNDPDRLFLLSLLPHLKSVPDNSRLSVKMELMKVLQNANSLTDGRNVL